MEKYNLPHVALYAKGWYKKNNRRTIWEDLKTILTLDGFCGDLMNKTDITAIILSHCQRLNVRAFNDLCVFADGINPKLSWKHGYPTKGNYPFNTKEVFPEYDYLEAIVRYCLSSIRDVERDKMPNRLPMPDYINGLPRPNGITNKKLLEFFA